MDYLFLPLHEQIAYLNDADKKRLYVAFCFSRDAHKHQYRQTGEAYITHPIAVASLLTQLNIDVDSLIAALLHDVIEDTRYTQDLIVTQFGHKVAEIVDGVSRLESLKIYQVDEHQAVNFGKLLLAMAKDLRVILIKLADRMHNIQSVKVFRSEKAQRIAQETLDIYVPLAAKIGLNPWRVFLENQCFKIMNPNRYSVLLKAMRKAKGERSELLENTISLLKVEFEKAGIQITSITGREKRPYSLFSKMRKKKRRFSELLDLFAFRIIVQSVDDCYRTLGVLHQCFKPVPGRFKDYIALPKVNGYQSLHSVLINAEGIQAEFQIRTQHMDINAEYGIAAHWRYKSSGNTQKPDNTTLTNKWLVNLLEMYNQNPNKQDFFESAKIELMPDDVFVFTPKGKIISLPLGSTALDFAYAIHTKVGNHAVEAKINLVVKSLDTVLQNGDLIKISTSSFVNPTPEKLHYVTTAKARSNIRNYLNKLQQTDLRALGRDLLDSAFEEAGITIQTIAAEDFDTLLKQLKLGSMDDLLMTIGKGQRPAGLVCSQLIDIIGNDALSDDRMHQIPLLTISDELDYSLQYARCCRPICQDDIIGHLSGEHGLVVHRRSCHNVRHFQKNPSKWALLNWQKDSLLLPTHIRVSSRKVEQILAAIANKISESDIDIEDVSVNRLSDRVNIDFLVLVKNRFELANLMKLIRKLPDVMRVNRVLV